MHNPTRQMENNPINCSGTDLPADRAGRHLWHLQGRAIGGLHLALGADPQYIAYQAEQKNYAEFDGTVVAGTTEADKGKLFCKTISIPTSAKPSPSAAAR